VRDARPLTCRFVFPGSIPVKFSTSARQGGTDTTAAEAQAPLEVAGPGEDHTTAKSPDLRRVPDALSGGRERAERLLQWEKASSQREQRESLQRSGGQRAKHEER
jgi:hypothetical protein